mgnify:CR=1 FL=1
MPSWALKAQTCLEDGLNETSNSVSQVTEKSGGSSNLATNQIDEHKPPREQSTRAVFFADTSLLNPVPLTGLSADTLDSDIDYVKQNETYLLSSVRSHIRHVPSFQA